MELRPDGSFKFLAPLWAFEKGDAPEGRRRRIGGLVSTDTRDRENEVVLQDGLDFSEFLEHGWFNDNHAKDITGAVGEPDPTALRFVRKGEKLPNGQAAPANGHWAEGWMIEGDPRADAIWQKAIAIQKSPKRRLGFSIEGSILRRTGADQKTIAKAKVRNVAITHCPVNTDTRLDVIAKSLMSDLAAAERKENESPNEARAEEGLFDGVGAYAAGEDVAGLGARSALGHVTSEFAAHIVPMDGVLDLDLGAGGPASKALSMGGGTNAKPVGPRTGAGAGRVLTPQSLEHDAHRAVAKSRELTTAEAVAFVKSRFPNISWATAGRVVDATLALKRRGLL